MATSTGPFSSSLLHLLAAVLIVFSSWVLVGDSTPQICFAIGNPYHLCLLPPPPTSASMVATHFMLHTPPTCLPPRLQAEPGELQHHHLGMRNPPRQLPWHAPGVRNGPTAPRRLLAGHPHRSLLATPGDPALRFQLMHRPSGGQPPTLVIFTVTPGAPVPGGKDLPLLFLLNGGNVEAEQYSQVRSPLRAVHQTQGGTSTLLVSHSRAQHTHALLHV